MIWHFGQSPPSSGEGRRSQGSPLCDAAAEILSFNLFRWMIVGAGAAMGFSAKIDFGLILKLLAACIEWAKSSRYSL